jgi:hypothetical protein
MRKVMVTLAALAIATAAFAGENFGKIVETTYKLPNENGPVDFTITDKNGTELANVYCSEVGMETKEVKAYWLDPEHMPKPEDEVAFTWASKIETGSVEKHVAGLCQLRNFNPGNNATIKLKVKFVGHVANRIGQGLIKAADLVPVANIPGEWGSVVNDSGLKGDREANLPAPKYLDLTEFGATVAVDGTDSATITWTYVYNPKSTFASIPNGQFEIGLLIFNR